MWRAIGSSTQESDPTDDTLVRIPEPRAVPSLHNVHIQVFITSISKIINMEQHVLMQL
jgi:hypothetical protein